MTSKKTNLKMQSQRSAFIPPSMIEDDNRIDWERKSRKDKTQLEDKDIIVDDLEVENEAAALLEREKPSKGNKKKRKKARHFVVDENSGRVLVKRLRKQNRSYDDWHDEYE